MENIYKKIENELYSLSEKERKEILVRLRNEVDEIDKDIVKLLSKRTLHSVLIGRVKRSLGLATYSPDREKDIGEKINRYREEPLGEESLIRIYERIIDESRAIQKEESVKGNLFSLKNEEGKVEVKNLLTKKEFIIVAAFFLLILAVLYYTFFTANYFSYKEPYRFEIRKGETLSQIAANLEKNEVIPSKTNFRIAAFLYGAERKLKAGRYYLPNGLSYLELIDHFLHGKADYLRAVNLHKGSTIPWIASRLKYAALIDSSEFVYWATNENFIDSLGLKVKTLEGYMLPQDYDIYERSHPKEVIEIFHRAFNNFWTDSLKQKAKEMGYSVHQITTVASIVEGETNKTSEMDTIAGVYYNRLKIGMKLQADPTVQYIIPGGWKRLLYSDLNIDNPYNTYKYYGLPPGPINNPGKEALLASINPAEHDFIFFVADGTGGHKFSKNYAEHLRKVRDFRQWLKSRKK